MTNTTTEVMHGPREYAALVLAFAGGNRQEALARFLDAVRNEPSFRLAPASWLADVAAALAAE